MDGRLMLAVAAVLCALPACQAPRLVAAGGPPPSPPASSGAGLSEAQRLAQPLLADGEGRRRGGPYDREVSEEAIRAVERAVRLRLEARRRAASACTAVERAERLELPTGRGDEYTGAGLGCGTFVKGLKKLFGR